MLSKHTYTHSKIILRDSSLSSSPQISSRHNQKSCDEITTPYKHSRSKGLRSQKGLSLTKSNHARGVTSLILSFCSMDFPLHPSGLPRLSRLPPGHVIRLEFSNLKGYGFTKGRKHPPWRSCGLATGPPGQSASDTLDRFSPDIK